MWWSSSSFGVGLGLGEVNIASNLSAPLRASITLKGMDTSEIDPGQYTVRIDGESGLRIDHHLQRIDADTALIHLYTRSIVSEPVIQFRVEVTWDRNTVARSYDAFLDPPAYRETIESEPASGTHSVDLREEPGKASQTETRAQPIVLTQSLSATGRADQIVKEEVAASNSGQIAGPIAALINRPVTDDSAQLAGERRREYGPTIDGNSIWRVARAVASNAQDLTIYQWMYAVWLANPQAFTNENMHRLTTGVVLAIPLDNEVREHSHREAWRAYSAQMALLQPVVADGAEPALAESVAANIEQPEDMAVEANDPAQARKFTNEEVAGVSGDDNAANSGTTGNGSALTTNIQPAGADEAGDSARQQTVIALLEESATARDERSIVNTQQDGMQHDAQNPLPANAGVDVTVNTIASSTGSSTADDSMASTIMPGEIVLDDIEMIAGNIEIALDRHPDVFVSTGETKQTALVGAASSESTGAETPGWYDSLQSRRQFLDGLPVIGADGRLAFIGLALQRADSFIATSPSWVTLAFGAWLSMMIVMLRNRFGPGRSPSLVAVAKKVMTPSSLPAVDKTATVTPAESGPVASPPRKKVAVSSRARRRSAPVPSESNARVIITQADAILEGGDADEAVKLMKLAVELQPEQPILVNRLLELYHQTRRREDFEKLLNESLIVLQKLGQDSIARLQQLHSQLFVDDLFPLAHLLTDDKQGEPQADPDTTGPASRDRSVVAHDSAVSDGVQVDLSMVAAAPTVGDDALPGEDSGLRDLTAGVSDDYIDRFAAIGEDFDSSPDDVGLAETQVIYSSVGVPIRDEAAELQDEVDEDMDLEVALKEADVYLAYGLYDNAEELLLRGMEVDPERADFLARLLDCYYATRNVVDFVSCAEVMLDMGDQGSEYWGKVEIMGHELAPYNKMFAAAEERSLSADELGLARPETADFDLSDFGGDAQELHAGCEPDESAQDTTADTDLNLEFGIDEFEIGEFEDTGDGLEQVLALDAAEESALPVTSQQAAGSDDISVFVLDDDDQAADEVEQVQSLSTAEILAIPETSEDSGDDDFPELDTAAGTLGEDQNDVSDKAVSLSTAEILAISGDSVQSDQENVETIPDVDGIAATEDSDVFEIDEEILAADLDKVGQELGLDKESDDYESEGDELEFDGEEAMEFTIEDTLCGLATNPDSGASSLSVVEDMPAELQATSAGEKVDGRILYFPENSNEDSPVSEFESEVKVTLQAMRDQLQYMTERLFRQERETGELRQALDEMRKDEHDSLKEKSKKSS